MEVESRRDWETDGTSVLVDRGSAVWGVVEGSDFLNLLHLFLGDWSGSRGDDDFFGDWNADERPEVLDGHHDHEVFHVHSGRLGDHGEGSRSRQDWQLFDHLLGRQLFYRLLDGPLLLEVGLGVLQSVVTSGVARCESQNSDD